MLLRSYFKNRNWRWFDLKHHHLQQCYCKNWTLFWIGKFYSDESSSGCIYRTNVYCNPLQILRFGAEWGIIFRYAINVWHSKHFSRILHFDLKLNGMRIKHFIVFFFRWPFNEKTPLGYLYQSVMNFLLGSCWLIVSTVDDINCDLNELANEANSTKVKQQLSDIVKVYSDVKELSICHFESTTIHTTI